MSTMPCLDGEVILGVDTHADTHTAALIDALGRTLAARIVAARAAGNRALVAWASQHGRLRRAGIEGTGSLRREPRALPGAGGHRGHPGGAQGPPAPGQERHP